MLYKETVSNEMWELLQQLMKDEMLKDFSLVGGTSLSLQIGHRLSIDIDLFTTKDFDVNEIVDHLKKTYPLKVRDMDDNTLMISINNVKVDILSHKYDWQKPIQTIENVRLASIEDIGAMKLHAIFQSGTRVKDFVDMYFLLDKYPLKDYLETYEKKYSRNVGLAIYSLTYFKNIEKEFGVKMLRGKEHRWSKISRRLKEASLNPDKEFGKSIPSPKKGKGGGFGR
ncbi:nucleotidyl transferase AbiEii/AbiGii toxin family protein [Elizabethkingia meningoseptica]|uniref:nucleotidyl transferase AbiEii/AbiGii toxin family protein n=1 Tax=Elizabethkingia meningoseptica TaxID=238 RepID=UPI0023B13171|nr:nucleotidyl transferase AbiEii/AbiGii toxin family protein [Elizabethkingia meningoseptica]MDE5467954.1 nucleotidyl transferase AbiEii/AbiGii toxin family protein [Elizabethkingia meningoseptica]MDE5474873.1 nucleotidyl transferase AbiEii/AbiGii toxin family protein [Elizabethkingia meningoseptica]MDE5478306.1 nucleotidyl transferase AbiEii/AbiGii toxin family protein [Elizabethkingia meningoseptica]MDE5486705.1 nucleotidyl transferase AbiEii/AbiGii toxin family protein [Elizabethkingia meni